MSERELNDLLGPLAATEKLPPESPRHSSSSAGTHSSERSATPSSRAFSITMRPSHTIRPART